MKCSNCDKEWPEGVKFCGDCGNPLKAAPTSGLSPAQVKVNDQLKRLLPRFSVGNFREIRPGHHIGQHGSTHVEVRVIDCAGKVAVRSMAPVTVKSRIDDSLMRFLLNKNASLVFGAFAINEQNAVIFSHTILASSMDAEELSASVNSVLMMADQYDDQIVAQWGGKTMKDSVMEQVFPPRVLELLKRAQLRR